MGIILTNSAFPMECFSGRCMDIRCARSIGKPRMNRLRNTFRIFQRFACQAKLTGKSIHLQGRFCQQGIIAVAGKAVFPALLLLTPQHQTACLIGKTIMLLRHPSGNGRVSKSIPALCQGIHRYPAQPYADGAGKQFLSFRKTRQAAKQKCVVGHRSGKGQAIGKLKLQGFHKIPPLQTKQ